MHLLFLTAWVLLPLTPVTDTPSAPAARPLTISLVMKSLEDQLDDLGEEIRRDQLPQATVEESTPRRGGWFSVTLHLLGNGGLR